MNIFTFGSHTRVTTRSERRDGDGNNLRVAVRDADGGVLDTGLGGSGLGVTMEL